MNETSRQAFQWWCPFTSRCTHDLWFDWRKRMWTYILHLCHSLCLWPMSILHNPVSPPLFAHLSKPSLKVPRPSPGYKYSPKQRQTMLDDPHVFSINNWVFKKYNKIFSSRNESKVKMLFVQRQPPRLLTAFFPALICHPWTCSADTRVVTCPVLGWTVQFSNIMSVYWPRVWAGHSLFRLSLFYNFSNGVIQ